MDAVKQSIAHQISERIEEGRRKSKEDLELANYHLEGRIDQTSDYLNATQGFLSSDKVK